MRIKKIYIKDFGIYNNQLLDELSQGIIVIGGLNRAGKSTFLQVLRYLGYGFPRGSILPPARKNYEVEADLVLGKGEVINLQLHGYAKPIINSLSLKEGSKIEADDIYNLDSFTYHRLFTLNLDELRRIPRGVEEKQSERLQSVLLGAGLKEILQIPQLEEDFKNAAEKIGGKNGDPKVKNFKPYYRQIEAGIRLRKEALQQVEEYQDYVNSLKETENEISDAKKQLVLLQSRSSILDILKNKYSEYSQRKKLEIQISDPANRELLEEFTWERLDKAERLRDDYLDQLEFFDRTLLTFKQLITDNKIDLVREKLLTYQDRLTEYHQQLSGLKERVKNYLNLVKEKQQKWININREMERVNEFWEGDYKKVLNLETDKIREENLTRLVENYQELKLEIKPLQRIIAEGEKRKKRLIEQLQKLEITKHNKVFRKYFFLALLFAVGGFGLSFLNIWSGLFGLAGLVGIGLFFFNRQSHLNIIRGQKVELEIELEKISSQVSDAREEMEAVQVDYNELKRQLEDYCLILGLDVEASPELIKFYFREVQNLKEEIFDCLDLEDELSLRTAELEGQLVPISRVIEELVRHIYDRKLFGINTDNTDKTDKIDSVDKSGIIDNHQVLFNYLERFFSFLDPAGELDSSGRQREETEGKIRQLLDDKDSDRDILESLNHLIRQGERCKRLKELDSDFNLLSREILQVLKTDRIREALQVVSGKDIEEDSEFLSAFESLYKNYTSVEDVEKDYRECEDKLEEIRDALDSLKEKRQTLRDGIDDLSTGEKLERAQKQIIRARADLKPEAEKFAVYNTAAFILKKIRKGFLEKTRDKLLDGASRALKQITGGEYSQIAPVENLTDADFKAISDEGRRRENIRNLSRGTREQLFLTVRMSRIREIDPPLPVIIDDTLVNFDRYHLEQTVQILNDLAGTNQVFVLTCHPHLIEFIRNKSTRAQYWKLEKGRFEKTAAVDLINHLSIGR